MVRVIKGSAITRGRIVISLIPRHIRRHVDPVVMRSHAVAVIKNARSDHPIHVFEIVHELQSTGVGFIGLSETNWREGAADDDDIGIPALDGLVRQS